MNKLSLCVCVKWRREVIFRYGLWPERNVNSSSARAKSFGCTTAENVTINLQCTGDSDTETVGYYKTMSEYTTTNLELFSILIFFSL
jgi:hypothetical protein